MTRVFRHLFASPVAARFDANAMQRIQQAIAASEAVHAAEICFAVERALSLPHLLAGLSARERALDVFAQLRVWDTERNNGVLIYVLLAEHAIEIVPDRDARDRVAPADWQHICATAAEGFARGANASAVLDTVSALTPLLAAHYPSGTHDGTHNRPPLNELPDLPNIL